MPDQCSIAATLEIIGDRWTILILRDAFRGVRRFDEIQHDLGIARNVLTDRLNKLVEGQEAFFFSESFTNLPALLVACAKDQWPPVRIPNRFGCELDRTCAVRPS